MSIKEPPLKDRGEGEKTGAYDKNVVERQTGVIGDLHLKLEKQKQDHFIALQGKAHEICAKDNEIALLKDEIVKLESRKSITDERNNQLEAENNALRQERETNAQLQSEVCDLNKKLNDLSALRRDYEAAVDTTTRISAERDIQREAREKLFEESRRLQEQFEEQTKRLDFERERLGAYHNSILNLGFEIHRLTDERNYWKEKYEDEIQKRHQNDKSDEKKKLTVPYSTVNKEENKENISGGEENLKRQYDMVNVNGVKRSKTEENFARPSSATGLSLATKKNSQSRPRKKFDMVPCNIPRCKNCGTIFHDGNSMATECRFHRVPPQSYEVWTKLRNQETIKVNPQLKGHLFWACCESHGKYRTKGCMVLRHHEIVYSDE